MADKIQLLVTLLMTPEIELNDYRHLWLGGADIDEDGVKRVRGLVEQIGITLAQGEASKNWPALLAACKTYEDWGKEAASGQPAESPVVEEEGVLPGVPAPALGGIRPELGSPIAQPRLHRKEMQLQSPWVEQAKSPTQDVPDQGQNSEMTLVADPAQHEHQTLPFQAPSSVSSPTPGPPYSAPGQPGSKNGEQPADDAGATAFLDAEAPVGKALPFEAPPSKVQSGAQWTVEDYAALCAECAAYPDYTDAINARHGIQTSVQRARLDLEWQQKMRVDTALKARWTQAFDAHKSALR